MQVDNMRKYEIVLRYKFVVGKRMMIYLNNFDQ